jgi:hypothetical protein
MNIWQNPTKTIPKGADAQIVRVSMDQIDIGGRKDHLPKPDSNSGMTVQHVPSQG